MRWRVTLDDEAMAEHRRYFERSCSSIYEVSVYVAMPIGNPEVVSQHATTDSFSCFVLLLL